MTPEQLEALALRYRAETGVIPYRLYAALDPEARGRVALTSQTQAQRDIRAAAIGSPPAPRAVHLTTRVDEAALAELARNLPQESR